MVAGPDMVSVDRVGIELMGIDYNMVKHVQYCSLAGVGQGDLDNIEVLGANIDDFKRTYRKTDKYVASTDWIINEPPVPPEFSTPLHVGDTEGTVPRSLVVNLAAFPNPFNSAMRIQFTIIHDSTVAITVFNVRGQKVRHLMSSYCHAGT